MGEDIIACLTDVLARLQSIDQSGIGYVIVSLTSPRVEGVFDVANATSLARQANDET